MLLSILTASEYQMKWALDGENRALVDVTNQVWELNAVWTQVQNSFVGVYSITFAQRTATVRD